MVTSTDPPADRPLSSARAAISITSPIAVASAYSASALSNVPAVDTPAITAPATRARPVCCGVHELGCLPSRRGLLQ